MQAALVTLALLALAPKADTRMIDVGGHKLRVRVMGTTSPTVVLEAGFWSTLESWSDVMPQIAKFARVVAYDRAGLGGSELGPEPRSYKQVAEELHTMLQRGGFSPPYVLVGHSMGGAHIRAFAALYKDEVAGLVFVDPFVENAFRDEKIRKLNAEQDKNMQSAPPGVRAEWRFISADSDKDSKELRSFGKPPDMPTMLLLARRDRPPNWIKLALEQYGPWIADATDAGLVVVSDSGHYIQRDAPEQVIAAIRRVVFPSADNILLKVLREQGVDAAIARYRELRKQYPPEYLPEPLLNRLGYVELRAKHLKEAIALFKLNVEMHPKGYNTYDSLAEAYLANGDHDAAYKNYRKSLELNPDNANATQMLEKIKR